MEWFKSLSPIWQALVATCFTWGFTALGASLVFFTKTFNQKLLDAMMGFAGGVMIAASFFSLLLPATEMASANETIPTWLPVVVGFLLGGGAIACIDKMLPHLHIGFPQKEAEGPSTSLHRSILLVLAITLHNIPEGLAIGVAFGSLAQNLPSGDFAGAVALAIGIGIQNFPEGTSVSIPLRREGFTKIRSFFYGQASAIVEPIAGIIGAIAVMMINPLLPYAMAFAAGAMIYVVVEELIPESQLKGNTDLATLGLMGGFSIMMALDVGLG